METVLARPRLSSYRRLPSLVEKTLMTVPFSEAEATREPQGEMESAARGES